MSSELFMTIVDFSQAAAFYELHVAISYITVFNVMTHTLLLMS